MRKTLEILYDINNRLNIEIIIRRNIDFYLHKYGVSNISFSVDMREKKLDNSEEDIKSLHAYIYENYTLENHKMEIEGRNIVYRYKSLNPYNVERIIVEDLEKRLLENLRKMEMTITFNKKDN